MFYIVTYDIIDDKRRTRLAKALKDFGDRVQYSVFECLMEQAELMKMAERIHSIIDQKEDRVRIYHLCGQCEDKVEIIGLGERTQDSNVYIL